MAINLSRSTSMEISESVSWFPSISSPFYLFRFGIGLSEVKLYDRSERFNVSTSSKHQIVSITRCMGVKRTSLVVFERA